MKNLLLIKNVFLFALLSYGTVKAQSVTHTQVQVAVTKCTLSKIMEGTVAASYSQSTGLLSVQSNGWTSDIVVEVKPALAKSFVKIRLVQTILGVDKRDFWAPPSGQTGEKKLYYPFWHFDGSVSDFTETATGFERNYVDSPEMAMSASTYKKLVMDNEFELFIQYKIKDGEWKTLKKARVVVSGTGEVTAHTPSPPTYQASGTTTTTITGFSDSKDDPVMTPTRSSENWTAY